MDSTVDLGDTAAVLARDAAVPVVSFAGVNPVPGWPHCCTDSGL